MYQTILTIHNIVRWFVVLFALLSLYRSMRGWLGKGAWREADRKSGLFYTIALDTQMLLGLLLFFVLSPVTQAAFADFGTAMKDAASRFFLLEHSFYMVAAVVLAHIGSAAGKKDLPDQEKFRRAALFMSLSVLAIILGMPWSRPFLPGM